MLHSKAEYSYNVYYFNKGDRQFIERISASFRCLVAVDQCNKDEKRMRTESFDYLKATKMNDLNWT